MSAQIVAGLDAWRDLRDATGRGDVPCRLRLAPRPGAARAARLRRAAPARDPAKSPRSAPSSKSTSKRCGAGSARASLREAFIRALIYIRLPQLAADERSFNMLQRLRDEHAKDMSLADFKQCFRDQFMMVLLEPETRWRHCRSCWLVARHDAPKALELLRDVLAVDGPMLPESERRLAQVAEHLRPRRYRASTRTKPRRRLSVAGGNDAD